MFSVAFTLLALNVYTNGDLDAAGSQGRPDYAGQFKANDGDKYLFALKATSKNNGEVVKSPFVYT